MEHSLYIGRLPRRGENKKLLWEGVILFSNHNNAHRINVCKSSANKMALGDKKIGANKLAPGNSPPIVTNEGARVKNITALWKYSKVHDIHYDKDHGTPTKEWYERREEGWVNGTTKHHLPRDSQFSKECSVWFEGKAWNFIEGRKEIWIHTYREMYGESEPYMALKNLLKNEDVLLLDFSCHRDHHLTEITKES